VHHKIQTGLWLAQETRRLLARSDPAFDFKAFEAAAAAVRPLVHVFDADDPGFRDPADMVAAIRDWFTARSLPAPHGAGALARAIYDSLALSYVDTLADIERLTGDRVQVIHVVGGGAAIPILLQSIADATGRRVIAGPVEAAVIGNMIAQLVARGAIADFEAGRALVARSLHLTAYAPSGHDAWRSAHRHLADRKAGSITPPQRRAANN
jgi:rhamnulokinase